MYAIIKTGGKQYRVQEGDIIDVELLNTDPGAQIEFGEVLFAFDGAKTQIGKPGIPNFLVYGEVVGTVKGEKVTSLKYKPSHNQCRKWGHRQHYTRVRITGIGSKRKGKEGKHGS
jgi:large subunit ribosomal protein L21